MTGDTYREVTFTLVVASDKGDGWHEDADEFIEWLDDELEGTDHSVAIDGPGIVAGHEYVVEEPNGGKLIRHNFTGA